MQDVYLTDQEQRVITMRFGIGISEECTLEQIASLLGVSISQVCRLESRALKKLRRSEVLRSFWEK